MPIVERKVRDYPECYITVDESPQGDPRRLLGMRCVNISGHAFRMTATGSTGVVADVTVPPGEERSVSELNVAIGSGNDRFGYGFGLA